MDRAELLKLRGLFESPQWDMVEFNIFNKQLEEAQRALEICPIDKIEHYRGQIKMLRELLALKLHARTAYAESKQEL